MTGESSSMEAGGSSMLGQTRQRPQSQQLPYRDDPSASPSVRLESFTRGGLGPAHANGGGSLRTWNDDDNNNNHYDDDDSKSFKAVPLSRQCWQVFQDCHQHCCCCLRPGGGDSASHLSMGRYANHPVLWGLAEGEGDNDDVRSVVYYEDHFNDMPWSCSVGTTDDTGVWLNRSDPAGTIMSILVWVLFGYSVLTMAMLAETGGIPCMSANMYAVLACLALASHCKTTLTDPGSVPTSAVPTEAQRNATDKRLSMCSQCQTFKPPLSHHCRICNRCISRMDHHCPWMNNCVGAGNFKHFLLFLLYTWTCSVYSLLLLGVNYFFCASETCMFPIVLIQLARLMTVISIISFLFTSSMIMNVVYGIHTGIGTIDRLKKKATGTLVDSDEEAIPLHDIFGIGPLWTWAFPLDPVFEDYDRVLGFSTPQRLLREQMRFHQGSPGGPIVGGGGGIIVVGGGREDGNEGGMGMTPTTHQQQQPNTRTAYENEGLASA